MCFEAGLGLIDYLPIPHYQSEIQGRTMKQIEEYCKKYNIKYKTIIDGKSIVEDTRTLDLEI